MSYRVTGRGPYGPLEESKEELWDAAYLASKMIDNGVQDVHVFDADGHEVDRSKAPLPPGWKRNPFR